MLPNFRVIVATFLCGFVLVFAGLRIVVTSRAAPATQWPALSDSARALPQVAAQTPLADVDTTFRTRFAVEDAGAAVPSELKLHAVALAVRGAPTAMPDADSPAVIPEIAASVPQIAPTPQSVSAPEVPAASQPASVVARVPATDGLSSTHQIEVAPANPAPVIAVEVAPATPEPVAAVPVARIEVAALPAPDASPEAAAAADEITATVQQENAAPRPVPTAGAGRDMPEADPVADSAADTKAGLTIAPEASKTESAAVASPAAPAVESKSEPAASAKTDSKIDSKAEAPAQAAAQAAPKPEPKAVATIKPQPDRAKLAAARKAAAQAAARKARQRAVRHAAAPVASSPPAAANPFAAMFGTFPAAGTPTTVR